MRKGRKGNPGTLNRWLRPLHCPLSFRFVPALAPLSRRFDISSINIHKPHSTNRFAASSNSNPQQRPRHRYTYELSFAYMPPLCKLVIKTSTTGYVETIYEIYHRAPTMKVSRIISQYSFTYINGNGNGNGAFAIGFLASWAAGSSRRSNCEK